MPFPITYSPDRSVLALGPTQPPNQAMGSLLPVSALKGVRELASARDEVMGNLAQQVFARRKPHELASRSRAGASAADAVSVRGASDHVVTVHQTARAAQAASAGFAEGETLRAGSLSLRLDDERVTVAVAEGGSLSQLAQAIRDASAAIDAEVQSEGERQRLVLSRRQTGYDAQLGESSALEISQTFTGGEGRELGLAVTQTAQNARLTVDGQTIQRRSNTINDAIVGTTLRLDTFDPGGTHRVSGQTAPPRPRLADGSGSAFTVSVEQIAAAAQARSASFSSAYDSVQAGKVLISVDGGRYLIPVAEGATLLQAAASIQASEAPVDVSLEKKAEGVALVLTGKTTGHAPDIEPESAFQVAFEPSGASGQALGLEVVQAPRNARVVLNGKSLESRTNELQGTGGVASLSLHAPTEGAQTVVPEGPEGLTSGGAERSQVAVRVARLLQDQLVIAAAPHEAYAAQARKAYAETNEGGAGGSKKPNAALAPPRPDAERGTSGPKAPGATSSAAEGASFEPAARKPSLLGGLPGPGTLLRQRAPEGTSLQEGEDEELLFRRALGRRARRAYEPFAPL